MPYLRVTRSRVEPSRVDEASQLVQAIVADIRQLPGFQSIVIGGNRATGEALAVTTFDTEEHARWTPDPNSDNASRIRALGMQLDPPEILEVTIQA